MIYNLFLNSTTNAPLTNYYSAINANDRGQRVYAVDWTFLPENKTFKVSFKFSTLQSSFTANSFASVQANFGPVANNLSAGSSVKRANNSIIGFLKPRQATTATTDMALVAFPQENNPIFLNKRPADNFLEITLKDIANAQFNLAVDYFMVISFEEQS